MVFNFVKNGSSIFQFFGHKILLTTVYYSQIFFKIVLFYFDLSAHFKHYTSDNFPYQKYNDLVMQLGISKSFKKKKGECINHEKAD